MDNILPRSAKRPGIVGKNAVIVSGIDKKSSTFFPWPSLDRFLSINAKPGLMEWGYHIQPAGGIDDVCRSGTGDKDTSGKIKIYLARLSSPCIFLFLNLLNQASSGALLKTFTEFPKIKGVYYPFR